MLTQPNDPYQRGKADRDRELLSASITSISKKQIIMQEVCTYFGISEAKLLDKSRKPVIVYPKHVYILLLCENGFDHDQVKNMVGVKQNWAVKHAVSKLKGQCEVYAHVKRDIGYIQTKVISRLVFSQPN